MNQHQKLKQWGWFIILWLSGLGIAAALAYPFKWLISFL